MSFQFKDSIIMSFQFKDPIIMSFQFKDSIIMSFQFKDSIISIRSVAHLEVILLQLFPPILVEGSLCLLPLFLLRLQPTAVGVAGGGVSGSFYVTEKSCRPANDTTCGLRTRPHVAWEQHNMWPGNETSCGLGTRPHVAWE